jgi:hypothetical protein
MLAVVVGFVPASLFAQLPAPIARFDAAAGTGIIGTAHADAPRYDRWAQSVFGDMSAGFYWTDHLKTEVDLLWASETTTYSSEPFEAGGYVQVMHRFQNRVFSAAQTYQFGRNAFFHPFVTAGVSVDRERRSFERPAQTAYFSATRTFPVAAELRTVTHVGARPFAATGFKAYFSERGFFRSDLKLDFEHGIEQVTWKAAFGVDF